MIVGHANLGTIKNLDKTVKNLVRKNARPLFVAVRDWVRRNGPIQTGALRASFTGGVGEKSSGFFIYLTGPKIPKIKVIKGRGIKRVIPKPGRPRGKATREQLRKYRDEYYSMMRSIASRFARDESKLVYDYAVPALNRVGATTYIKDELWGRYIAAQFFRVVSESVRRGTREVETGKELPPASLTVPTLPDKSFAFKGKAYKDPEIKWYRTVGYAKRVARERAGIT